jgi:hypothetical protein
MPPRRSTEDHPATRAAFFERERAAWAELSATWEGLPDDALLRPGACGAEWSIKDVMNHVAAWQAAALRVIRDLLEGRWGRLGPNTDKFNALRHAEDHDRPLDATRRRLSATRDDLLALLDGVPEDRLLNVYGRQQIGWWAKYATYAHYGEHIGDLTEFRHQLNRGV